MTNEEKFKTPEERLDAFKEFCESRECHKCELTKQTQKGILLCVCRWLALESEEEKLLPCPLCGHEVSIITDNDKGSFIVDCGACGCQLMRFSREYAIAAWNRRAK